MPKAIVLSGETVQRGHEGPASPMGYCCHDNDGFALGRAWQWVSDEECASLLSSLVILPSARG